ncbi:hypothetical protein EL75_4635 [Escherichia coli]|nr:hypothetical protein EL75_4635 [Escherichia coli]KGM74881.1 hypothetical protein EL80_5267 [Escherichia coli]KGM76461.1 hypothetical protein EL79_5224 [Escherichia coli]
MSNIAFNGEPVFCSKKAHRSGWAWKDSGHVMPVSR